MGKLADAIREKLRRIGWLERAALVVLPMGVCISLLLNLYDLSIGWNVLATIGYIAILCAAAAHDFSNDDHHPEQASPAPFEQSDTAASPRGHLPP